MSELDKMMNSIGARSSEDARKAILEASKKNRAIQAKKFRNENPAEIQKDEKITTLIKENDKSRGISTNGSKDSDNEKSGTVTRKKQCDSVKEAETIKYTEKEGLTEMIGLRVSRRSIEYIKYCALENGITMREYFDKFMREFMKDHNEEKKKFSELTFSPIRYEDPQMFSIYVSKTVKEYIENEARKIKMSKSPFVEKILRDAIKKLTENERET